MMALEGLTFGEGVWLTFTTITTTGYGDFSAKTAAGRSATIVLIYLSGIFLLTQAGSAFFELRTLRRERMRRGEWRWNLQDHIVFINAPEAEPGDYLRRLMDQLQRSHAGFSRVPALVLTENFPDGLPASLEDDPQIAHVRGRFDDPAALHAAAIDQAAIVVVLAEREGDRISDSHTFDVIHSLRDRGIKARIIAECVDDRNRDRLKRAGANAVVRPLRGYPEMIVRAIVAPGSFAKARRPVRTRILGRGQTPWSAEIRSEITTAEPGGLIVADLGTRPGLIAARVPTIVLDHHVPMGVPEGATLISGHALAPIPTSSLLALWCASALGDVSDLLWLAALGLIGDMAEKAAFPEMDEARRRYGITALRDAVSLINAPRRSASGDPAPALALLITATAPKEVTAGDRPEVAALRAAKEEVKAALDAAKRVGPKVRDGIALLRFDTPCQVHPLLAQTWRGRLKGEIVLAANAGYRTGWVHFAARTARDVNLIEFLAQHAPPVQTRTMEVATPGRPVARCGQQIGMPSSANLALDPRSRCPHE